jgi:hypothetical protein
METRCEVCGEPVNLLADYAAKWKDKVYQPREFVEWQLNLTQEEKDERQSFFEELFAKKIADNAGVIH